MSDRITSAASGVADHQPDIERTRRELLNFLAKQNQPNDDRRPPLDARAANARRNPPDSASGLDWPSLVEAGMSSWWHDHPARAGATLVRSATEDFARRKPLPAVAIAAAAGAAIVLLKPWRLMSVTAVALTLFRSSNFTGMATSVLETAAQSMQKERT